MIIIYYVLALICGVFAITLRFIDCPSRNWLSAYMGFLSAYLGLIILDAQPLFISPSLYFCLLFIIFLPGPLLLGYISHISSRKHVSIRDFIICLLPILIALVSPELLGGIPIFSLATEMDYEQVVYTNTFNIISAIAAIQTLIYLVESARLLVLLRNNWNSYQSNTLPKSWYQMTHVILVMCLGTILQAISAFINPAGNEVSLGDVGFILLVVYFIWLSASTAYHYRYHGNDLEVIQEIESPLCDTQSASASDASIITNTIKNQALFLEHELSLPALANQLGYTPHHLSEIINHKINKSFYEFINGMRIEYAATQLIEQPNKSITNILYEAGFTNKSTFYNYFKKSYQCAPSEYRQQHKHK